MHISACRNGETIPIKKILGKDTSKHHLESMGFVEGADVKIVSKLFGSIIVDICGSRVAIDESMAERIIV